MFRHVILWKIIETPAGKSKEEIALKMKELLEGLNGKIPGVILLQAGVNVLSADNAFDIALIGDFESKEAYAKYSQHPEHAKIVPFFKELKLERAIADYEIV